MTTENEVTRLRALIGQYQEALIWCSGSPSFQREGEARIGWEKLCAPLITPQMIGLLPPTQTLLSKDYSGESIVDIDGDVNDAIVDAAAIPKDEHGFHAGTFHITFTWDPMGA